MPFNVGPLELIIILVIALLILGPGKLPEVGASLGKSIREFRKAVTDVSDATRVDVAPTPTTSPNQAQTTQPAPPQVAAPQPQVEAPSEVQSSQLAEGAPTPNVISEQAAPNEIAGPPKA
jgi:sec-independent protein translocase protein TatA